MARKATRADQSDDSTENAQCGEDDCRSCFHRFATLLSTEPAARFFFCTLFNENLPLLICCFEPSKHMHKQRLTLFRSEQQNTGSAGDSAHLPATNVLSSSQA